MFFLVEKNKDYLFFLGKKRLPFFARKKKITFFFARKKKVIFFPRKIKRFPFFLGKKRLPFLSKEKISRNFTKINILYFDNIDSWVSDFQQSNNVQIHSFKVRNSTVNVVKVCCIDFCEIQRKIFLGKKCYFFFPRKKNVIFFFPRKKKVIFFFQGKKRYSNFS